jgi:hypothetical protein
MVDMRDDRDIAELHLYSLGRLWRASRPAAGRQRGSGLAAHIVAFSQPRKGRVLHRFLTNAADNEKMSRGREPDAAPGVGGTMIKVSAKYARRAALAAASATLVLAAALSVSGARQPDQNDMREVALLESGNTATPAEKLFPDAPDGVDPMVTGPVSAEFRARQQAAGCAQAEWPNIPAECYPD